MLGKLATLITVFTLAFSTAALASPADVPGFEGDTGGNGSAGTVDRADLVGAHDQEEEEFTLYLGPQEQDEIINDVDDRRVN